jgi:hypothetical protein
MISSDTKARAAMDVIHFFFPASPAPRAARC